MNGTPHTTITKPAANPLPGRAEVVKLEHEQGNVVYTLELLPSWSLLLIVMHRNEVASSLGVNVDQLHFEPLPAVDGRARMRLTVLQQSAAAQRRLSTVPPLRDGELVGVGRFVAGPGTPNVRVWSEDGMRMVPVALAGRPGSGRSNALRVLAGSVLRTAPMHLLVVDPSGFRDSELDGPATIVLRGQFASALAPEVINSIMAARRDCAAQGQPRADLPGWMVAITNVGSALQSSWSTNAMLDFLRDGTRLGLWPVAIADSMDLEQWAGSKAVRDMFAEQVIAFDGGLPSAGPHLGIDTRRAALPSDELGRVAPGHARLNYGPRPGMPIRFDWVPGRHDDQLTADEEAIRDQLLDLRPRFELDGEDRAAITSVLGAPDDNGRWVIGDQAARALLHLPSR